jgi:hypothetical protein
VVLRALEVRLPVDFGCIGQADVGTVAPQGWIEHGGVPSGASDGPFAANEMSKFTHALSGHFFRLSHGYAISFAAVRTAPVGAA